MASTKIYRVPSNRLAGWDYGSQGLYFITICTKDRVNYFGTIADNQSAEQGVIVDLTKIGSIAHDNWLKIPDFSPFTQLDDFVVMPNHLHGILFINKPHKSDWEANKFGPQKENLASIIRGYKSSVTKHANDHHIEFSWQAKYHDHIIRNENEYRNIRQYIYENPRHWLLNGDDGRDGYSISRDA